MIFKYIYTMRFIQKIASFLMLALLLAFSQYPCTDRYFMSTTTVENVLSQVENTNENQTTSPIDFCSPLCVCSCCSTLVRAAIVSFYAESSFSMPLTDLPLYFDKMPNRIDMPIWQPPKIG